MQRDRTNETVEARLRRMPKLHLSLERSSDIRAALERNETAIKRRPRFLHPVVWVAVALFALIGGTLSIPYPGTKESVLAHWSAAIQQRLSGPVSERWLTESEQRDLAIKAMANLYQTSGYTVVRMKQTETEAAHQPMYLVELKGNFKEGSGPQSRKVTATHLSFSILADGSKVWALTAGNGNGNGNSTKADVWSVSGPLDIKVQQMIYRGNSQDWTAVYRQARVNVWHKNTLDNQDDLGMSIKYDGQLTYTGPTPPPNGVFEFSIEGAADGSSGSMSVPPQGPIVIKMPNLQLPDQNSAVHVSATIGGHTESFTMHDITNGSTTGTTGT